MGFTRPDDLFPESGSLKSNRFKILVVDDDESLREFLEIFLANEGYLIRSAANGEGALELLAREDVSLVISDVRMPGIDGVALLKEIKTSYPDLPVILITAFASMDSAVAAMKEGAWDYLTKPFRLEEIRDVVEKALETRPETQTVNRQSAEKVFKLDGMVARSPAMLKIFQLVPRIASSLSSVLVSGESGTGKELVARAVHNLGTRKEKAFVTVNCGGIPENLLESELFGYCRGAFTGADIEKPGLFAIADGGTIFLDEIGELPMMLQVKLLRVV
ncbi:MAG TPA: sigma-54-dependent Fis family transcriptional regulator, partial [Thermodesulfobacteriaceae bacterium]|nr:sigma-54-dependent Fis family transcriptional regulator [Thermodesulfobacteriaceae bacterium]